MPTVANQPTTFELKLNPSTTDKATAAVLVAFFVALVGFASRGEGFLRTTGGASFVALVLVLLLLGGYFELGVFYNRSFFSIDMVTFSCSTSPFPLSSTVREATASIQGFTAAVDEQAGSDHTVPSYSVVMIRRNSAPRRLRLKLNSEEQSSFIASQLNLCLEDMRARRNYRS